MVNIENANIAAVAHLETFTAIFLGALLGIISAFVVTICYENKKTKWAGMLYFIGVVSLVLSVWSFLKANPYVGGGGFVLSILYIPIIYIIRCAQIKDKYTTKELTPKIVKFTNDADLAFLWFLFGDISCFGTVPEMDGNKQYKQLRDRNFEQMLILCEAPKVEREHVVYGKILTDFQQVKIKHYNLTTACDVGIRGRIIKAGVGRIHRMQLYRGMSIDGRKLYTAVERDGNHQDCDIYVKIWDLLWNNADAPSQERIAEYKEAYSRFKKAL